MRAKGDNVPKSKYEDIFKDLQHRISRDEFKDGMLPTEAQLTEQYEASRNTVRRAISELARLGYVQSIRGRGVVILDRTNTAGDVELGIRDMHGSQSISSIAPHDTKTRILTFTKVTIDDDLARKTGLPVGDEAYYLQRLRILDGHAWSLDHNWFLCSALPGLTIEIAERSIYRYLQENLGKKVVGSRRTLAIRRATNHDRENLELDGANCVGVIFNTAFTDNGHIFEFTETHYSPEHFTFTEFIGL